MEKLIGKKIRCVGRWIGKPILIRQTGGHRAMRGYRGDRMEKEIEILIYHIIHT